MIYRIQGKAIHTQIERDFLKLNEFFIKLTELQRINIEQAKTLVPRNMFRKFVEANLLKEH